MGLTNVQRVVFDLSGAALPYSQSIGTVAVGDVVLFQVLNRTSTSCNFSGQITDSGAGNRRRYWICGRTNRIPQCAHEIQIR
jgi:hypothetical protein